jgi:hypothetical protein
MPKARRGKAHKRTAKMKALQRVSKKANRTVNKQTKKAAKLGMETPTLKTQADRVMRGTMILDQSLKGVNLTKEMLGTKVTRVKVKVKVMEPETTTTPIDVSLTKRTSKTTATTRTERADTHPA